MDDHLSQYSDSPSVYGRPYFDDDDSNGPESMLDLDEDPRASYVLDDDEIEFIPDDASAAARLSYLGPKMRFHSRAPWEMDGEALEEDEDEEDDTRHTLVAGLPFARPKTGSSSPRPSFQAARPSGESSRAHIPPKRSFETINSQISYPLGALYTLAQESMSASTLSRPKDSLRNKFSLGRLRPDTPTGSQPAPLPPPSPARSRFQSSPDISVHPYANPDLAAYANDDDRANFLYSPTRNDSSMTVTETVSADSIGRHAPTLTPDTSLSSIGSRPRLAAISAKNISAPVPVTPQSEPERQEPHYPPPIGASLAGWKERGTPPAFALISLEEARAQRMRSSTATGDAPRASGSSAMSQQTHLSASFDDAETSSIVADSSPLGSLTSRARGRSISAGAKAKSALHTIVGQPRHDHRKELEPPLPSAPFSLPVKSLKHKKSGFMRLFNGNKNHDRDDHDETPPTPPPVPALPQQAQPRPNRTGVQRIPVPSLSPSLTAAAEAYDADDASWAAGITKRAPPSLSITTEPNRESYQPALASSTSAAYTYDRPWTTSDQLPQSAPANVSSFPALRLRPVSTLFSAKFSEHIVPLDREDEDDDHGGARSSGDTDLDTPEPALDTPRSSSPGAAMMSPTHFRASGDHGGIVDGAASRLAHQVEISTKSADQRQIRELEGRVRELQAEVQELRGRNGNNNAFCIHCGRGKKPTPSALGPSSVVNRPRARTGTSSRFGSVLP